MTAPAGLAVVAVAAVLACQCPGRERLKGGPPPRNVETAPAARAATRSDVEARYLGSGGFLIKRGETALMTAPLYSNPFLPRYDFCGLPFVPNAKLITAFVKDQGIESDLRLVKLVLSGHAHYDHLMDVPKLLAMYGPAPAPYVVGSTTAARTLAGYGLGARVIALNEPGRNFVDFKAAVRPAPPGCEMPDESGRWWPDAAHGPDVGGIRIFPTVSDHPPQLGGVLFWPGCRAAALPAPPTRIDEYPVGEVMAFLIDLLDEQGRVAFRIYYEDAPLPPSMSGPLEAQIACDGRGVDLALLCTGNWREVPGSHTIVSKLRARDVILHHWEFFFDETPPDKPRILLGLPGSEADPYRDLVIGAMPGPHPASHVRILKPGVLRTFAGAPPTATAACPRP